MFGGELNIQGKMAALQTLASGIFLMSMGGHELVCKRAEPYKCEQTNSVKCLKSCFQNFNQLHISDDLT